MFPRRRTISSLALVMAAMGCPAAAQDQLARLRPNGMRTIAVQGSASVSVAPDVAQITVGAETRGPSAREALTDNNKAMTTLLDVLKQHGVDARDVQTSGLTLSPIYDRPTDGRFGTATDPDKPTPKIVGYEVDNSISIVVRDVGKIGELLDAMVKTGVNKIEHLSFSVSDPRPTLRDLRKRALADARAKAEEVATEGGLRLGPPVSIEVDDSRSTWPERRSNIVDRSN
jgi:uncharacterized protein